MHFELTRRSALAGAGLALGTAMAMPGAMAAALAPPGQPVMGDLIGSVLRMFRDPVTVRWIGSSCVRCWSAPIFREAVLDEIFGTDRARLETGDDAQVHDWLRGQVREDFAAGRTTTIDGWVLSRTEVRLYGLVTLV